ncbi:MAG: hypothetical protein ACJ762_07195 [Solirubrobacteraceae bacterium]
MSRRLLVLAAAVLAAAPVAADAADPGRWKLAQSDSVPLEYFQGLTHGTTGNVLFLGLFEGAYRTDRRLKEQARVAPSMYPADVAAIGFNHAGDPTSDTAEGGRFLIPMECYRPDMSPANTCGIGGFGVLDPTTLAWRYWVRLDQADIPKAMWAEVSPEGRLIWTSSGNDLLAYRTADIAAANAATSASSTPIKPVQRLTGVVPPSGITGAVFQDGRLLLSGESDGLLQVWSVDLTGATPSRLEIELPGVNAEPEGLDNLAMRGGLLHWLLSPLVADPTYGSGHSELLTFVPAGKDRLKIKAVRSGRDVIATVSTAYGALQGAVVRAGTKKATTAANGKARLRKVPKGAFTITASKPALRAAKKTVR